VLVRSEDDGTLVIGQLSHAWLSGQLAREWGNARFGAVEPHEEIVLGACQHDIGWARVDLEPRLNYETGQPRSFLETTVDEHLAIWRDAPELLLSQSAYAALVVSLHGRALSELRARNMPEDALALRAHIGAERARQEELRALLGVSAAQSERLQRQMWTWDGLSLALCHAWPEFTAREVPSTDGLAELELRARSEAAYTLDPWPFAATRVEARCEVRRIDARYSEESALRAAFARAAPLTIEFTLVPR
jgi:Protein of unknown function (DUF3891)